MTRDRWVVLGLASVRAPWFRQVTGWAMSGVLPIDFVKCVSTEEVLARLRSSRTHSAILVDGSLHGVDRDLLQAATRQNVSTFVVTAPTLDRDWAELGSTATLPPDFTRADLLEELQQHAVAVAAQHTTLAPTPTADERDTQGRLISVIGRAGSGVSTTAIAVAQGLADDPRNGGRVVLVDFARRADLAVLHDAHDIVPGLQELTEAHRVSTPSAEQVRAMTFNVAHRGYDLLLGLRRPRDWTSLRPAAFEAAVEGLRRAYHFVIADLDDDLEGAEDGGSSDVEDRNLAARHATVSADVVLAVGTPTLVGVHALVRLIDSLTSAGVDAGRIQPVISRAPQRQRDRADLARTIADLVATDDRLLVPTPVHVPERRHLDDAHRNGTRIPTSLVSVVVGATTAALARNSATTSDQGRRQPELVIPGSLGALATFDPAAEDLS